MRRSSRRSGCRSRRELDTAAPDNPVVLVRGGHDYILNTAALRKWNITRDTAVPEGGAITRGADGEPNGELVDSARALVSLPPPRTGDGRRRSHHPAHGQCLRHHQRADSRQYKGEFFQALDTILDGARRPASSPCATPSTCRASRRGTPRASAR